MKTVYSKRCSISRDRDIEVTSFDNSFAIYINDGDVCIDFVSLSDVEAKKLANAILKEIGSREK